MKKLTFGYRTEENQQVENVDFVEYIGQPNIDNNPYGGNYFDNPQNAASAPGNDDRRITSIPSPYARMHLTDIAFKDLFTYGGDDGRLSGDYRKAISHCLDMFEIFYRFDQLDLLEKGIKVERSELVTGALNNKWRDFLAAHPNTASYIETLDLYRKQYLEVIHRRDPTQSFKFTFTDSYVFYDSLGRTFGSTSPFTGFFTTADCDLHTLGLDVPTQHRSHKLLTANPQEWVMLSEREIAFQDFMFVLLNPNQQQGGLGNVFHNLWRIVELAVGPQRATTLRMLNFAEKYPRFNFSHNALPILDAPNFNGQIAIRSSEMDSSYLKYLLFYQVQHPIRFAIDKELYADDPDSRFFPDNSGIPCPWLGVNDILSDALFVLPYDINKDYLAINYEDENGHSHRRCLPPINSKVLKYMPELLDPQIAADRIRIRKFADGHYSVSIQVFIRTNAATRAYMILRREYWPERYDSKNMIFGRVYTPSDMNNFAFGIYPFVKANQDKNIYKVLFYNQLKGCIGSENADVSLKFFTKINGVYQEYAFNNSTENRMNYTEQYNPEDPNSLSSMYYHIEGSNLGEGIDFVELSVRDDDSRNINRVIGTSLIVPLMSQPQAPQTGMVATKTRIAIDLGTSNTYIAYQHGTDPIYEINMVDQTGKAELRFMHQPVDPTSFQLKEIYRNDLCLMPAEGQNAEADKWTRDIASQLCEFIPTRIMQNIPTNLGKAFTFPIPTVINTLRQNGQSAIVNMNADTNKPLIHSNIPFAYYEVGKRNFDAPQGDFKWFVDVQRGMNNSTMRTNLELFVSELLFIIRSHMLYNGYSLHGCEIIWTYPLAFDDTLRMQTELVWQKHFIKNFRADAGNYANPATYPDIRNLVRCTNESLSPFFYCANGVALSAYQVLVDIGGGSTDIIGYSAQQPIFISSFAFAGNHLYGEKSGQISTTNNLVRNMVNTLCDGYRANMMKSDFPSTRRIDTGESLSALMNYGFQKFPNEFNLLWVNPKMKFLLKFHAAAIIYQTAQMCYMIDAQHVPYRMHLAGNGSKLMKLLPEIDNMFNVIFATVFNQDNVNLQFTYSDTPKFAAAQGSLMGYDQLFGGAAIQTNNCSYITTGDGKTKFPRDSANLMGQDKDLLRQSVKKNVVDFIDLFYELPSMGNVPMLKDEIINYLEQNTENDPAINLGADARNIFFEYIESLLSGISATLCNR